ncbi:Trace amine-associated receptor 13c [Triplophysa tibetana]|uniref:Trace amine-associated receptor 13c n=1 Tax=Triplophysa tibetana TaxID=1572043 RepID=A0A5A9N5W6_9TELE|nr:Trace amine-associated receptor 13c [Triplophysa tibetana]
MAYDREDHETQYCFPAVNSSCIKTKRSTLESNVMYVFFSLLSVWTVFLNLLVIISVSHFKKLHTPTNMLILSLAVADMLVGLIVMPLEAIKLIEGCWYFGDSFCGLYTTCVGLLLSASLSNLMLIAVDRYVAVCHPLLYPHKITTAKTLLCICICWFCSSAYNSALVFSSRLSESNIMEGCFGVCTFTISYAWRITDLIFSLLFPCSVIITLYLRIFYVVHQQVKVINSMLNGKSLLKGSLRRKSETKAALTLGLIVTVYLICWIPFFILLLTEKVEMISSTAILLWILYVSSAVNPLIYAFFYPWFKMSVKHIITLKIFQPASSLLNIFTDLS